MGTPRNYTVYYTEKVQRQIAAYFQGNSWQGKPLVVNDLGNSLSSAFEKAWGELDKYGQASAVLSGIKGGLDAVVILKTASSGWDVAKAQSLKKLATMLKAVNKGQPSVVLDVMITAISK